MDQEDIHSSRSTEPHGEWAINVILYLESEPMYIHQFPQPREGSIDEGQYSQKGNQVSCYISNKAYCICGSIACSFQDILLLPVVIGYRERIKYLDNLREVKSHCSCNPGSGYKTTVRSDRVTE